jgi:ribosome-associated toxin RatA of RatAB toxin-antitoxin module
LKRHFLLILLLSFAMGDSIRANALIEPIDESVYFEFTQKDWPMALRASTDIPVEVLKVWNVLTDYDHLADYLPKMEVSRVVQRIENQIILEQVTRTRFLFLSKKIAIKLNIVEKPYEEIAFERAEGNLELFSGQWVLKPIQNGWATRLTYQLKFKPAFYTPKWVVRYMLSQEVREQIQLISARARK